MSKKLQWEPASSSGYNTVVFHPDGKRFYMCCSQTLEIIEIQKQGEEFKINSHETKHHGIHHIACSSSGEYLVSVGNHEAYLHNLKTKKYNVLLTRYESSIYTADFSFCNQLVATASAEGTIKIQSIANPTDQRCIKAHEGMVKTVAFDPRRKFLASAGVDGLLKIWDYTKDDKLVASLEIVPKSDPSITNQFCRMAWHPHGEFLAVPTSSGVAILSRNSFKTVATLKEIKHEPNIVCWSPNGKFLISAHYNDSLFLWDVTKRESIDRRDNTIPITGLSWNSSNEVCIASAKGDFALWTDVVDKKKLKDRTDTAVAQYEKSRDRVSSLFDDEAQEVDDEEEEAENANEEDIIEEDVEELLDDNSSVQDRLERLRDKKRPKQPSAVDYYTTNTTEEESNVSYARADLAAIAAKHVAIQDEDIAPGYMVQSTLDRAFSHHVSRSQKSFQVNSSPMGQVRRFLVWNEIGHVIAKYDKETNETSIRIEFTDKLIGKGFSVSKPNCEIVHAALSDKALILASRGSDTSDATLFYHQFNEKWESNNDWLLSIEKGELVENVSMGKSFIAVNTSKFLRIFSTSGIERMILCPKGPVVTMTAMDDILCVIYQTCQPFPSSCRFVIYNLACREVVMEDSVALTNSPDTKLVWVGFTDIESLATLDNHGVLRMLLNPEMNFGEMGGQWAPLLSLKQLLPTGEKIWPIRVSLKQEKVIYAPCKGTDDSPSLAPIPTPSIVQIRMPTCTKASNEEKLMRNAIMLQYIVRDLRATKDEIETATDPTLLQYQADQDKQILALLKTCIDSDKLSKALEWASRLHIMKSYKAAISFCGSSPALASKIVELPEYKKMQELTAKIVEAKSGGQSSAKRKIESVDDTESRERPAKKARTISQENSKKNSEPLDLQTEDANMEDSPLKEISENSTPPKKMNPFASISDSPKSKTTPVGNIFDTLQSVPISSAKISPQKTNGSKDKVSKKKEPPKKMRQMKLGVKNV